MLLSYIHFKLNILGINVNAAVIKSDNDNMIRLDFGNIGTQLCDFEMFDNETRILWKLSDIGVKCLKKQSLLFPISSFKSNIFCVKFTISFLGAGNKINSQEQLINLMYEINGKPSKDVVDLFLRSKCSHRFKVKECFSSGKYYFSFD